MGTSRRCRELEMSNISNEEADYGYSQYQDFKMQQEELGYYAGEQQDEDIHHQSEPSK
jgi:hypothetical protein